MKKIFSVIGMVIFYTIISILEEIMTAAIVDEELNKRGYTPKK